MRRKISTRAYAEALYDTVTGVGHDRARISATLRAFIERVIQDGGRARLPEIVRAYTRVADEKDGSIRVELTAAHAGSLALPEKMAGMKVYVERSQDPSLIGGVRLRVGDTLVDNSLKTRIARLRSLV